MKVIFFFGVIVDVAVVEICAEWVVLAAHCKNIRGRTIVTGLTNMI